MGAEDWDCGIVEVMEASRGQDVYVRGLWVLWKWREGGKVREKMQKRKEM